MKEVHVRVPATTANLGPGFDSLGIALKVYNTTTVRRVRGSVVDGMAAEAASAFFGAADEKPFGFAWSVDGDVPRSRGLGSSVTVRLGILHGLNELAGRPLDRFTLFRLCSELEGHPDNAAPAAFGGFAVAPQAAEVQRFTVDAKLSFVLLIPGFEMLTSAARKVVPKSVALADAVRNVGNAAAIAAAFASGDYRKLAGAFGDTFHQPYRESLLPCLSDVIDAGRMAGALGGWLSGSGSTIACATLGRAERVARAMAAASGLEDFQVRIVAADNAGVRIRP
ncbi:MAG: homoserine kinase [Terrimicrobiaceae bacterium]|nr:homoserine kinase [Terrimicrobiaceae bacterium]